ncbi:NAD(P)-dependent oxidoreductase [Bradyrhizobium sp. Tv2a-2]|uniref:NAD(P)-dependent oxidoreductase n=1 Tax=Bradyrhizobium sp. Tv2a-2 TaxID=113395 RepID=UPI000466D2E0|nr:NAD(P)-dependent oxidoreductase [Bradyrhizobium sp. Tv2a-2]
MKVLCLWHATKDEISKIREALPRGTEIVAPEGDYFSRFESTYQQLEPHARDADAFIGWALPRGLLEIADKLKLLSWLHSGCDDLANIGAFSLFKQRGVKVANIRGGNAIAVAEQAMMFVLALAKKTIFKHQVVAQDGRRLFPLFADEYRSAMLNGRTIGVIGVGSIGSEIAKRAKGFNMRVLGVRRNKDRPVEHVDSMHGVDELHSVLAKCDYVVLATPNTKEAFQFFGKAEIAAMKPSAFLINIARGNLVQEKPLYEALTSGRLRGYASDAWQRYEFGRAFPISFLPRLEVHKLPNVVCSNDQAANADDVLEGYLQWGIENLVDFATEKPLRREVNLDLGY